MAIRRTKSGYRVSWYDAQGRERKQTFKGLNRDQAEQKEREILYKRDHGEETKHPRQAPIFGTYAAEWVEQHRPDWKESTLTQYENILNKHLLPVFGSVRISSISAKTGLDFRTRLYDAGLSPRRINLILLVLKMILKAAGYSVTDVKQLRVEKSDIDPLAPHEVEAVLLVCPNWWKPLFTVLFCCGARPGELAALKWGDIDWRSNTFRIRARRLRGVESTPKTRSSTRNVDMLPPTLEAFKVQRTQQAAARLKYGQGKPEEGKDYVFTGTQGGCLSLNFIREKVWSGMLERAKLRRRTFYQTRHTFASNALAAGENPKWVADMLGHKSTEILFNVYERFIPRRTRLDGTAFVARMKEESEAKNEPHLALQYDRNTTVFAPVSNVE